MRHAMTVDFEDFENLEDRETSESPIRSASRTLATLAASQDTLPRWCSRRPRVAHGIPQSGQLAVRTTSCLRYVTAHRPLTTAPPRLIMTSKAHAADTVRSVRWSPHHRRQVRQVRQDSVALRQLSGSSDVSLSLLSGHLPRSRQGPSLPPTATATVMVRTSTFLDRSGRSPLGMRSLHAAGVDGPAF